MPNTNQVVVIAIVSIFISIFLIAHGVFFDLDFSALSRLSIGGVLFTSTFIFAILILLEHLFDLNN